VAAWADTLGLTSFRGACVGLGLVVGLVFTTLTTYVGFSLSRRERDRAQWELVAEARSLAAFVDGELRARLDGLAAVAEALAASRGDPAAVEAQIRLVSRSFPDLATVLAVDDRGAVVASGGVREGARSRGLPRRLTAADTPAVGDVRQAGNTVLAGLFVPAEGRDGQVHGAVAAEVILGGPRGLLSRAQLGTRSGAEILTPSGVIAAGDTARLEPRDSADLRRRLAGDRALSEVTSGDGVRHLVGAAVIQPAGWVATVVRPVSAVAPDIWTLVAGVIIAVGPALVVGVVPALLIVRRPVQELAQLRAGMRRLASGDIPSNVAVSVEGEVGALAEAYNRALGWLRRGLSHYRALGEFEEASAAALSGDRPWDAVITDVLRNVVSRMGGDVGIVFLAEEDALVSRAAVGVWGIPTAGIVLRPDQGLCGSVRASRAVEFVRDTADDRRADEPHLRGARLQSVIAAPMFAREGGIGVVEVGYRAPRAFTYADGERLAAMVSRLVQALEHARALEVEPDLPARVAILKRRAALEGLPLGDDLALYIAREVPGNIRELESCLTRISAFCDLTGREPSLEVLEEFFTGFWHPEKRGAAAADASAPAPFLAVVRRGATELFETLKRSLERPGVVEVIWDRRVGARRRRQVQRVGADRRRGDRRHEPPLAPGSRDYILVRRTKP
jgi:putative methionine-R-sulfoxide reductase with GAF domain